MEEEEVTSTRIVYSEECSICKKKIKGFNESHLKYNMKLHKEKHEKEAK